MELILSKATESAKWKVDINGVAGVYVVSIGDVSPTQDETRTILEMGYNFEVAVLPLILFEANYEALQVWGAPYLGL